ncbi:aminotransferase class III-fold pyridoxal phosphate-dependent enzyme [Streptomyces physcomitrii]|uniref:aminotransferase class III-fold pyridoxal phosphate-dependent enzyme n=1 Tax=Streptomyces physcomitrii TaxID=2724184 RepID=UPI0005912348
MALTEPAHTRGSREPGPLRSEGPAAGRPRSPRGHGTRAEPGALPIVPVRARGLTVEGADGRRYLDCLSGEGALALGHNHPVVLAAIRGVLDSGEPLQAAGLTSRLQDAFVTELFRTLPPDLAGRARVRFCSPAGARAAAAALRLVRPATGRSALLTFADARQDSCAGDLAGAEVIRLPAPREHPGDPEAAGLREAEALLTGTGGRAGGIAGVLLAPVRDEGGTPSAQDAWLRRLRALTAAHGVPLLTDETRTGLGRTGTFWGVEHSGVVPDVMVLAGALGGGLPLAALVHREEYDGELPDSACPFRANQLALAAGAATLAHIRRAGLADRAARLGGYLLGRLRSLADGCEAMGEVHGRGLMIGIPLLAPGGAAGEPPAPAPRLARRVRSACLARGLLVGLGGPDSSVVRLLPPLTLTEEQAAAVLDRLAEALSAALTAPADRTFPTPPR